MSDLHRANAVGIELKWVLWAGFLVLCLWMIGGLFR